jgi:hypothetical protein
MRWYRWSLPLLALVFTAAPAAAQGIVIVNPYASGTSFNFTRVSRHGFFSISAGSYGFSSYSAGYYGYPFGYASSVNIVTYSPAPVIIVPRSDLRIFDDDLLRDPPRRERDRDRDLAPMERPLPGRDAGDFRPLDPDNRRRAERPAPPDPPLPPPKKEDPPPKPPEPDMPPPPRPPMPEENPVAENARLIGLGKAAFAAEEYGRAAQRFRQAATVLPTDALSHFLHAQALLALGKYQEAVDAINAGMALDPGWPLKKFQPLELYGPHVAAYPEHLRRLEDTRTKFPNDAVLLFLSAYQLWFDGRKDEARPLFQRARPGVADPGVVDRFLKAKPDAPPVAAGAGARNWL